MNPRPTITGLPVRVLIVDDERDNRELLDVILGYEGFLVSTASSGEEALASVASLRPDVILLDVMMPGMNGYEVTAVLKGDLGTKSIVIMLVSALTDRTAKTLGQSAGADDFLSKPFERVELVSRVRSLLLARDAA
jgi:CheY-like chemotaxis protein